jgi:hypothetical protein
MEYLDADEDLMDPLQSFTREHYGTLLRDKRMPAAMNPQIFVTIGRTLSIRKMPQIDELPSRLELEFCKSRTEALSAIQ